MNEPQTISRHPSQQDRTAYLRSLLNKEMTPELVIDVAREVARLAVEQDKDLARIPFIANQLAGLSLQLQEFIQDQLLTRQKREKSEADFYRVQYEQKKKDEQFTSQKIEAVRMVPPSIVAAAPTPVPLSPWTPVWIWFREKILPWAVILLIGFLANAVWVYFKLKLGLP